MPESLYQMPQEPEGQRVEAGVRERERERAFLVTAQQGVEHGRPGMHAVP